MKNIILALAFALIFAAGGFGLASFVFKATAQTAASIEDSAIRTVYLDDGLRNAGLQVQRVLLSKKVDRATIYASFSQPFSQAVILKAYDRTGAEIGRSIRNISGTTDEATYVDFEFNANVPLNLAESFRLVYAQKPVCVQEQEVGGEVPDDSSEADTNLDATTSTAESVSVPAEENAETPQNEVPDKALAETESAPEQTTL